MNPRAQEDRWLVKTYTRCLGPGVHVLVQLKLCLLLLLLAITVLCNGQDFNGQTFIAIAEHPPVNEYLLFTCLLNCRLEMVEAQLDVVECEGLHIAYADEVILND